MTSFGDTRLVFRFGIFIILILFLTSCAGTVKSGHYVQLREKDNLETLAKEFNVSQDKIAEMNKDKAFRPGEWVFIPLKRGILENEKLLKALDPKKHFISGQFLWPVPGSSTISSGFGRRWGRMHEGLDISAKIGSTIVAVQDGVVIYSGDQIGGYGNITVIAHRDGLFTVYAHAKTNYTKEGQKVYKGQVIAEVGITGRSSGPHLHFEMRKNGEALDPADALVSSTRF